MSAIFHFKTQFIMIITMLHDKHLQHDFKCFVRYVIHMYHRLSIKRRFDQTAFIRTEKVSSFFLLSLHKVYI